MDNNGTQDCLTKYLQIYVCRPCPIQSNRVNRPLLLHRVQNREARNLSPLVCPPMWPQPSPASHSSAASSFTFWKNTMHLFVFTPCNPSSLESLGSCSTSFPRFCLQYLV